MARNLLIYSGETVTLQVAQNYSRRHFGLDCQLNKDKLHKPNYLTRDGFHFFAEVAPAIARQRLGRNTPEPLKIDRHPPGRGLKVAGP